MNKTIVMLSALLGLHMQSAGAAATGWYTLNETWRDGRFAGRFYYDDTASEPVIQVSGTLTDIAQSSVIGTVWAGEKPAGASWSYVNNALPADLDTYNAGFYLNLVRSGTSLALNTAADNGLYDWSGDFAYFTPEQLNGSPLLAYSIAPLAAVPEPSTTTMLSAGLLLCLLTRRRLPSLRRFFPFLQPSH